MDTTSVDDNDESEKDVLDGFGLLFNEDETYSCTSILQSTLRQKDSPIIEVGETHGNSSGDVINESNEDEFDGIWGLYDEEFNSSTCNLQPPSEQDDSTTKEKNTHCCSSAFNGIIKCCSSLTNMDTGCSRSLKNTCNDMKKIYKRYYFIIRMAITSLIVCAVDMISDVWTSVAHFERCDWWWGTTSAILVILPMSWIAYTLIKKEMWNHDDFKGKKNKAFLVVLAILQVLVIYWFIWKARTWWTLIKEKKGNNDNLPKRRLEKEVFQFKKVKAKEGLLEGGLQLSLQSYILLKKIKNFMINCGCPDNCNDGKITKATSSNSFSMETCIDYIQIGSIILSLFALSYSQACIHKRHKKLRQLAKFVVYIQIISIRMFIPAVLAVFDNQCKWFLAPAASLICYSILYYIRRFLTKRGFKLPKVLEITQHNNREKVLARSPKDVLYWGLNHMLFNVTSVSGLAISVPYMICSLPYVVIFEDDWMESKSFYIAAAGLSIICVIVNIVFVICFRDYGQKIIPLSSDP